MATLAPVPRAAHQINPGFGLVVCFFPLHADSLCLLVSLPYKGWVVHNCVCARIFQLNLSSTPAGGDGVLIQGNSECDQSGQYVKTED